MYVPAAFAEPDAARLHAFLRAHSFATLVTHGPGGMVATHLPMLLDPGVGPRGVLLGHLARANPQWRDVEGEALAIFHGPHAYVSPAWYGEPGTVPTWNYAVAHVYGRVELVEDPDGLLDILRRTVRAYEDPRPDPWRFDEAEPHVDRLLGAIVGVRLEIARIEGKWKLSQNHPEGRRRKVIEALGRRADDDSRAVAAIMAEALERSAGGAGA